MSQRARIVCWMDHEARTTTDKNIATRAVRYFPLLFRGTESANVKRVLRLWGSRDYYRNSTENGSCLGSSIVLTRNTKFGPRCIDLWAKSGRSFKRQYYTNALHLKLKDGFARLKALEVKFSYPTLLLLAKDTQHINTSEHCSENTIDPAIEKFLKYLLSVLGFKDTPLCTT